MQAGRLGSDASPLRAALDTVIAEQGCSLKDLTVLAPQNDPFRVDTAARHRDGEWLAITARDLAGHEAVFAAAEDFVITAKSDGILIPPRRNALLAAGTRWYADRLAALRGAKARRPVIADDADADTLLRAAQGALAGG